MPMRASQPRARSTSSRLRALASCASRPRARTATSRLSSTVMRGNTRHSWSLAQLRGGALANRGGAWPEPPDQTHQRWDDTLRHEQHHAAEQDTGRDQVQRRVAVLELAVLEARADDDRAEQRSEQMPHA